VSRWPGLKGLLAFFTALIICLVYSFDVPRILFDQQHATFIGILLTSLVAAGGSAGAIAIFQGYLGLNKGTRDAKIAAGKAQAETAASEAKAKKEKAQADRAQAETAVAVAKAKKEQAEAERADAEARNAMAQAKLRQMAPHPPPGEKGPGPTET